MLDHAKMEHERRLHTAQHHTPIGQIIWRVLKVLFWLNIAAAVVDYLVKGTAI